MIKSPPEKPHFASEELNAVNAGLADLMNCEPAALVTGAERSLDDPLVICGILGGKDVGKSTLINALAGTRVSPDEDEVGTGTTRPMAYVHRDVVSTYRRRFAATNSLAGKFDVTEHDAEAVRNVVLVDMPDFDSEFTDHLEIVSAVAPLLDRILWVVTPRKIADRSWVEMFPRVIKDRRNVYCVLNKTDEILGDEAYRNAAPDDFWQGQHDWVRDLIAQAGCRQTDSHRFLVSALTPEPEMFVRHVADRWGDPSWSSFQADRPLVEEIGKRLADELKRLRDAVLSPVTGPNSIVLKRANRRLEIDENVTGLREHFALDEWRRLLDHACDPEYHQAILNEAFGPDYSDVVGRRLRTRLRRDSNLADDVLSERVGHWPLLRIVYWPSRWLVRRIGGRLAGPRGPERPDKSDPFDVSAQSVVDRLEVYAARLGSDHPRVIRRFGLANQFAAASAIGDRIKTGAATLVSDLDQSVIDTLRGTYRRPGILRRGLLWLVLLWFPFVQPLAQGFLEITGEFNLIRGSLQVVRAFSATHLITGLAVVLAVYVLILSAMYARCVVVVRQARHPAEEGGAADRLLIVERLDDLIVTESVGAMSRPFTELRDKLERLQRRLDRLSSSE